MVERILHLNTHSDDEYLFAESGTESASNTIHAQEERTKVPIAQSVVCPNPPEVVDGNTSLRKTALTVVEKYGRYHYAKPLKEGLRRRMKKKICRKPDCSKKSLKEWINRRLPVIECASNYDIKKDLFGDVIAGVTIAVMHIPQGMAYAMLGNLDPIVGIYMALYPVLFYAIFASSRHSSMGTFAVICLMTGKVVSQFATTPDEGSDGMSGNFSSLIIANATDEVVTYSSTEVATIVSFGVAIWMMIFGFLNLGSLSVFLSDMFISGFTTGAAVQVFTSQLKSLFGVAIGTYNGAFQIVLTWYALFGKILESNPATMVISILCISVITFNNEVIKPRLLKYSRIPFPIEFIMVVIGTVASSCGHLNEVYEVKIVGHVPSGLPPPALPPFALLGQVITPCLTITIVSFSISYSMAKLFAKKNDYVVDATQELYATGVGNVVGSFFQCAPISASLSRSLIQESVGGVTQLTSFISCALVLLALLFIGPFVEPLPHCVLAAIIVSAIKGMFRQFGDFTRMWKISKAEASIWMISFLGVVVIDVDYGLILGIFSSMLLLIYKSQTPTVAVLGKIPNTDIYLDKDRYETAVQIPGLKLLHVAGTLHFANQESFRHLLIKSAGVDPRDVCKMEKKLKKKIQKEQKKKASHLQGIDNIIEVECPSNGTSVTNLEDELPKTSNERNVPNYVTNKNEERCVDVEKNIACAMVVPETRNIVIDLSGVGQMDISGATNLATIYKEFSEAHISVHYTSLQETCMEKIESYGILKDIPMQAFFHSIQDAVFFITAEFTQYEKSTQTTPSEISSSDDEDDSSSMEPV